MTTYVPQEGIHIGRPPCANCGANYHLHHAATKDLRKRPPLLHCPEAYRPDTLEVAFRALRDALNSGDDVRVFAARGDVQRLGGDPDAAE